LSCILSLLNEPRGLRFDVKASASNIPRSNNRESSVNKLLDSFWFRNKLALNNSCEDVWNNVVEMGMTFTFQACKILGCFQGVLQIEYFAARRFKIY